MEVSTDVPFTVTFTRKDYLPSTISVQIQPPQTGVSDPKFAPNPVFARLAPTAKKPAKPAPNKPTTPQ